MVGQGTWDKIRTGPDEKGEGGQAPGEYCKAGPLYDFTKKIGRRYKLKKSGMRYFITDITFWAETDEVIIGTPVDREACNEKNSADDKLRR